MKNQTNTQSTPKRTGKLTLQREQILLLTLHTTGGKGPTAIDCSITC